MRLSRAKREDLKKLIAEQLEDMRADERDEPISRDKRLVTYVPGFAYTEGLIEDGCYRTRATTTKIEPEGRKDEEHTTSTPSSQKLRRPLAAPRTVDPIEQRIKQILVEAIPALAEVVANCQGCGKRLPGNGEDRVTVIEHSKKTQKDRNVVFCRECYAKVVGALPTEQQEPEWLKGRSETEKSVWELHLAGKKQSEIAQQFKLKRWKVQAVIADIQAAMLQARAAKKLELAKSHG